MGSQIGMCCWTSQVIVWDSIREVFLDGYKSKRREDVKHDPCKHFSHLQPWEWQKLHMQECRNKIEEIRNDSCHKELTSSYPAATMLENVFFFLIASGALLQVCLFTLIQMYSTGLAAYERCLLLTRSTFPLYPQNETSVPTTMLAYISNYFFLSIQIVKLFVLALWRILLVAW